MKKHKIYCIFCGNTKFFPFQGHNIDGSWQKDHPLPKRLWGGWVCSYNCYEKISSYKNNKKILKKEV